MARLEGCSPSARAVVLGGSPRSSRGSHLSMTGHGQTFPVLAMRLRIRVLLHALRKPLVPPLKEGRRSAKRRTTGFRPAAERKACLRCGARYVRPCPALPRDLKSGALAFRRSTAVMRRGFYPPTRFRAALPGITGSKRENPLRHQCSQHLAVRSRAGRSMPRTARDKATNPSPGNRTRPISRRHRLTSLTRQADRAGNGGRGGCQ